MAYLRLFFNTSLVRLLFLLFIIRHFEVKGRNLNLRSNYFLFVSVFLFSLLSLHFLFDCLFGLFLIFFVLKLTLCYLSFFLVFQIKGYILESPHLGPYLPLLTLFCLPIHYLIYEIILFHTRNGSFLHFFLRFMVSSHHSRWWSKLNDIIIRLVYITIHKRWPNSPSCPSYLSTRRSPSFLCLVNSFNVTISFFVVEWRMSCMSDWFLFITIIEDKFLWVEARNGIFSLNLVHHDESADWLSLGVFFITVPYLRSHDTA